MADPHAGPPSPSLPWVVRDKSQAVAWRSRWTWTWTGVVSIVALLPMVWDWPGVHGWGGTVIASAFTMGFFGTARPWTTCRVTERGAGFSTTWEVGVPSLGTDTPAKEERWFFWTDLANVEHDAGCLKLVRHEGEVFRVEVPLALRHGVIEDLRARWLRANAGITSTPVSAARARAAVQALRGG